MILPRIVAGAQFSGATVLPGACDDRLHDVQHRPKERIFCSANTIGTNLSRRQASGRCKCRRAGIRARAACSPAAICMAEGSLSLEGCPLLTWSLGWTRRLAAALAG